MVIDNKMVGSIMKNRIECPACHGKGSSNEIQTNSYWICDYCNGSGEATQKKRMEYVRSFIGMDINLRCSILAENERC